MPGRRASCRVGGAPRGSGLGALPGRPRRLNQPMCNLPGRWCDGVLGLDRLQLPPSPCWSVPPSLSPPPAPRLPGKPPRASRRPGTPPSWGEGLSAPWPAVGFYARAQPRGLRQPRWRRAPRAAPRNPTAATAPAPSAPGALPEPRWAPARRPGAASPDGRRSRTCLPQRVKPAAPLLHTHRPLLTLRLVRIRSDVTVRLKSVRFGCALQKSDVSARAPHNRPTRRCTFHLPGRTPPLSHPGEPAQPAYPANGSSGHLHPAPAHLTYPSERLRTPEPAGRGPLGSLHGRPAQLAYPAGLQQSPPRPAGLCPPAAPSAPIRRSPHGPPRGTGSASHMSSRHIPTTRQTRRRDDLAPPSTPGN